MRQHRACHTARSSKPRTVHQSDQQPPADTPNDPPTQPASLQPATKVSPLTHVTAIVFFCWGESLQSFLKRCAAFLSPLRHFVKRFEQDARGAGVLQCVVGVVRHGGWGQHGLFVARCGWWHHRCCGMWCAWMCLCPRDVSLHNISMVVQLLLGHPYTRWLHLAVAVPRGVRAGPDCSH